MHSSRTSLQSASFASCTTRASGPTVRSSGSTPASVKRAERGSLSSAIPLAPMHSVCTDVLWLRYYYYHYYSFYSSLILVVRSIAQCVHARYYNANTRTVTKCEYKSSSERYFPLAPKQTFFDWLQDEIRSHATEKAGNNIASQIALWLIFFSSSSSLLLFFSFSSSSFLSSSSPLFSVVVCLPTLH